MIKEFQGEYRWLSNFTTCVVLFEGVTYESVECAYQASKTLDPKEREWFQGITSGKAKGLGRKVKIRSDWEDVKVENMRWLLCQKFSQSKFKKLLLDTGDEHIQEGNMWNDKFWGVCLKTGEGENNLGKSIMDIRSRIRTIEGVYSDA